MATQHASGSTLVTDTETVLGTNPDTTAGVFQLLLDLSPLARGDSFKFRVYDKPTGTGDAQILLAEFPFVNEQDQEFISPAFILIHGWKMTGQRIAGTNRTITWSQRKA